MDRGNESPEGEMMWSFLNHVNHSRQDAASLIPDMTSGLTRMTVTATTL